MLDRERRLDLACLAGLALVTVAFFWPVVFGGRWLPQGGGDLVSFTWPMARFSARSLRRGVVPLWNPYLYSGAPFLADNQSAVFYPLNLLAYALAGEPSYAVMEALVILHIWLAGAGMFALARALRLRRAAAMAAGVAFGLSDLFITHLGNLNLSASACWLPLLLLTTHQALTGKALIRRTSWAVVAGVILGISALAGHAQMLLFLGLTLALYLIYRLLADWRSGKRRALSTLGLWLLVVVIGIGSAALTLLPAYEMAGHTGRGHLPFEEASRYSLPPRALLGLAAPGFYGRGPADFWGPWERVEVGYVGVVTLMLAALGVAQTAAHPGRHKMAIFFLLLVAIGFLLALGKHTPLFRLLYDVAPAFDRVRAPARLILLADLGLVGLAALGIDGLIDTQGRHRTVLWTGLIALATAALLFGLAPTVARRIPLPDRVLQAKRSLWLCAGFLAAAGLLLIGSTRWPWLVWGLALAVSVELAITGSTVEVEGNDPRTGFWHEDVVAFLRSDPTFFRIEAAAGAWQPNAALVHQLYDSGGVYNPLMLAPYEAYRWAVGERGSSLYNLLGVKYVLVDKGSLPSDVHLVPAYTGNPAIDVYRNTSVLPRLLFVQQAEVVDDHGSAWQAIHAPTFDPVRTVILERRQAQRASEHSQTKLEADLSLTHYGLNDLTIDVYAPVDGYVVLSDVHYPGWRATVDGAPVDLLRADYIFRAVPVPAGEHQVHMWFAPGTWRIGLLASGLTWLGILCWAAIAWGQHRRRSP